MTGYKPKRGGFQRGGYGKKRSSPDDDDTSPRASKKTKDEDDEAQPLVLELQKDDEGNDYVALKANDLRRVTISTFKGQTLVSIREYWKNDADEVKPGKKGISLTLDQFNALVTALPLLESALVAKGDRVIRPAYDEEVPGATEEEDVTIAKDDEDEEQLPAKVDDE